MSDSCKNKQLAQSGPFQIQHCADCGSFAVHLGPLSFRLDHEALRALGRVVAQSLELLEHPADSRRTTTGPLFSVATSSNRLN